MSSMSPRTRLVLCFGMILISALYGLIISANPRVASSIALGYIALLLTVLAVVNVFKRS